MLMTGRILAELAPARAVLLHSCKEKSCQKMRLSRMCVANVAAGPAQTVAALGQPAVKITEQCPHSGQSARPTQRAGPPDAAGQKQNGIRPTEEASIQREYAHFSQRADDVGTEAFTHPRCLQWREIET